MKSNIEKNQNVYQVEPEKESMIQKIKPSLVQISVLILLVMGAYYIGYLQAQVNNYKTNSANVKGQVANNNNNPSNGGEEDPFAITNAKDINLAIPGEFDHKRGNLNAKYALIEYSDFECPYCSKFHEEAKKFLENSNNEVVWVFRQYPLSQIHPDAYKKAMASECLGDTTDHEKFWKYADAVFEREETIKDIPNIAKEVGSNMTEFNKCYNNDEASRDIEEDMNTGNAAGVQGTPANFLVDLSNGSVMTFYGAVPSNTLEQGLKILQTDNQKK